MTKPNIIQPPVDPSPEWIDYQDYIPEDNYIIESYSSEARPDLISTRRYFYEIDNNSLIKKWRYPNFREYYNSNFIENRLSNIISNIIIITGKQGSGKSLIANMINSKSIEDYQVIEVINVSIDMLKQLKCKKYIITSQTPVQDNYILQYCTVIQLPI